MVETPLLSISDEKPETLAPDLGGGGGTTLDLLSTATVVAPDAPTCEDAANYSITGSIGFFANMHWCH